MNWLVTSLSQRTLWPARPFPALGMGFQRRSPRQGGIIQAGRLRCLVKEAWSRIQNSAMLGLGSAIGKYRKGVVALGPECSKQGLRGLFLTQPTMWRDDLNKTEREIIWAGKVESPEAPKGYVSINDLVQAMARYNQTLLDACSSGGLECYDRATRVPKDESAMFDDCHFNENVAHIVAGLLAGHLSPIRYPFPWRRLSSPMLLPVAVVAGAARVVAFAAGPKHTRFGWASIQLRSR